jgi:DNA ligase-1
MFHIVQQLRATTKGSVKEGILAQNDSSEWREYLRRVYSTVGNQYYVKKYSTDQPAGDKTFADQTHKIYQLLEMLAARTLTGGNAITAVEAIRARLDADGQELFDGLLRRDVKGGIGITLINKIYKNLIPEFDVALAGVYNEKTAKLVHDGEWKISRKLDGCRCIAMNENGVWSFWSRGGNEFKVLQNLKNDLDKMDLTDVVLDGELCIVNDNGDEDFQSVMKEVHKKDHTIEKPLLQAFDMLDLKEFISGTSAKPLSGRLERLQATFASRTDISTVKVLEQVALTSETFAEMTKRVEDGGWEGLILRKDVPYENGRSKNMLKVKEFADCEVVIDAVEIGDLTYAEAGKGVQTVTCVRAIKAPFMNGGYISIGSGLSKEQRIAWYNDPSLIVGKTICLKYFELTQDQNGKPSARFPTLKFVYDNGRNV